MKSRINIAIILAMFVLSSCTLPTLPDLDIPDLGRPTRVVVIPPDATNPPQDEVPVGTATATTTPEIAPLPTETSPEATPTVAPTPPARFVLQAGTPLGTTNFAQPGRGCNWMGIGGQVFGLEGLPVTDLVIEVGGTLGGSDVSQLAVTGGTAAFGPGGYLVELAEQPIASEETLWLQLYDSAGEAQSTKITISTYAECERNLVLVNFSDREARADKKVSLPLILK